MGRHEILFDLQPQYVRSMLGRGGFDHRLAVGQKLLGIAMNILAPMIKRPDDYPDGSEERTKEAAIVIIDDLMDNTVPGWFEARHHYSDQLVDQVAAGVLMASAFLEQYAGEYPDRREKLMTTADYIARA